MILGRTFELYVLGNIAQRSKASHCSNRALKGKCRKKSLRIFYSRTLLDISLVNPSRSILSDIVLFVWFDYCVIPLRSTHHSGSYSYFSVWANSLLILYNISHSSWVDNLDQEIFLRETFTVLGHSKFIKFIACFALSVDRYV